MIIKRLYDEKLAQASWLVGCAATKEALIVDPARDVGQYLAVAEAEGLRVTHVTETHIHADFVSGLRELAVRTGARAYLSDEGGEGWRYGFAEELGAVLLRDGDEFRVGNIRVQALHTPGHTPEHLSFLVTDTAGADRPMGAFTGDFIFVGDVGRPDLLEKAAGMTGTMESGARRLHESLARFKELPDWLQLWPGHGAGSACGKALGAVPQTTLGYERLFNWGLAAKSESEFVAGVLAGQPEPPKYFAVMKRVNRDGPALLGGWPRPPRLPALRLPELIATGAAVVDARPWSEYAAGHLPGSINIPLNRSFPTWAGSLLDYDAPFYVVAAAGQLEDVVRDLVMIGLEGVAGWVEAGELADAPGELHEIHATEARAALEQGAATLLDVRGRSEWEAGHVPAIGAGVVVHIPLGELPERLDELPRGRPVLIHCQSGSRSAIAASLLAAKGFERVANVRGGLDAWKAAGQPVVRETAVAQVSS